MTEKISKTNQLQKRIEELEKLNARSKSILEEQESITVDLRKKHELERQQLEQQFLLQNESSEQNWPESMSSSGSRMQSTSWRSSRPGMSPKTGGANSRLLRDLSKN